MSVGPDVAPNFYPATIGVWRSVLPGWAVIAAVRGAELSVVLLTKGSIFAFAGGVESNDHHRI